MSSQKPKTPEACLAAARRIAGKHGMFVVAKRDCWLVYRRNPNPDGRGIFLGRRTTPHQLLTLVHACSQTTGAPA